MFLFDRVYVTSTIYFEINFKIRYGVRVRVGVVLDDAKLLVPTQIAITVAARKTPFDIEFEEHFKNQ